MILHGAGYRAETSSVTTGLDSLFIKILWLLCYFTLQRIDEQQKWDPPRVTLEGTASGPAASPWPRAPTSMGSPRGVPVPCTLTSATSAGSSCATPRAVFTRAVCAGPLGAVSPLDLPAWLYADPAHDAQTEV